MSLKSNFEYIRDWCNHRFLRRDEKVDIDLSNYYTKNEVDSNISSATPDISVSMYSSSGSKSYNQTISNNGQFELSRVATSGSYNDLSDTPTIPAAQVQSDWNATSGMGVILNKPTIVQSDWNATSGMGVILNKPTIPAAQVQSDWNATSGMGVILNKPDLSEYMTVEDYQTDEEVVAAALNDLDGRIKTVAEDVKEELAEKQDAIEAVQVNIDGTSGTPSGSASMSGNTLSFSFSGIKGNDGATGPQGPIGPAGVTSAVVNIDNTSGTPSATATVQNGVLTIDISGIKGEQGNSGYTGAAGELEVVNNDTGGGAAKAWSAERGKVLVERLPESIVVEEEGIYFIDTECNIGAQITSDGLSGINLVQSRIIS